MTKALLAGVLVAAAIPAAGYEGMRLRVSPEMSVEPARITVQISIEPDADNRTIEIVAESAEFYRSSQMPLDGANASRTTVVYYRGLPAGEYEVRGILIDRNGRERAVERRTLRVVR